MNEDSAGERQENPRTKMVLKVQTGRGSSHMPACSISLQLNICPKEKAREWE